MNLNNPPKTGDSSLDSFLHSVYTALNQLDRVQKPAEGWSLTDFTAPVSEIIGDKRDLIDIVTSLDGSAKQVEEWVAEMRQVVATVAEGAPAFAQIMEWWDQNYKIIADAQESLTYKKEAEGFADDAKREADRSAAEASDSHSDRVAAQEAASDAALYRQGALTYREGSKGHREASEAARALSEAAQALSEQFRDSAKAHREAAATSESNAASSASAASTDANKAKGSATEAAGEVAKATEIRGQVEAIETTLRALMEDTEAWQSVETALESVDGRISTGMQQVKNDILGGVGPAFDTLLELAEALGENADAIGTLTNELANKADKGHTHVSADITDAYYFTGGSMKDRVVKTYTDGHIFSASDPGRAEHLARKAYVDAEVAKKANVSHTHVISDTSGLQTALDGKAPSSHVHSISDVDGLEAQLAARAAKEHKHVSADISDATASASAGRVVKRNSAGDFSVNEPIYDSYPANKGYVDALKDNIDGQGASIIPFNSVTGRQRWADGLTETVDPEAPTGRYYHNGDGWRQGRNYDFEVDPGIEYYCSMWVKASKPGSRIYIEMRDQKGSHAIQNGNLSSGSGTYLLANYEIPTEWTLLESNTFKFKADVYRANINTLYFNHANGSEREADQMLTDIQLIPIPKLTSKDITDATWQTGHSNYGDRAVKTNGDGFIYSYYDPTSSNHLARKSYVDTEVAKKSGTGHKHVSADITDASYQIGSNYTSGTVVTAHPTNGDIYRYGTAEPSNSAALVNKFYVDKEVGKKADSSHTHTISEVTGLQAAIDEAAGAATWSELEGKPSTFPPSSHTHHSDEITGTIDYLGNVSYGGRLLKLKSDGQTWINTSSVTESGHATNKAYVDARTPKIEVVSALPSSPDPNTVYIVK